MQADLMMATQPFLPDSRTLGASIREETVLQLFQLLAQENIAYAVLRNDEDYPTFRHDLDLVVPQQALGAFRKVLIKIAKKLGWQALCECRHWSTALSAEHTVEVFRFYQPVTLETFQIDVFHASLVWGLPLFTESTLLRHREYVQTQGFYRLQPDIANVFRMLQLDSLFRRQGGLAISTEKLARYREAILVWEAENPEAVSESLEKTLGESGKQAVLCLKTMDVEQKNTVLAYKKAVFKTKCGVLLRFCLQQPLRGLWLLLSRLQSHWHSWFQDPCGMELLVPVLSETQQQALETILNDLRDRQWFYGHGWKHILSWIKQRHLLERGGVLLALDAQQADESLPWGKLDDEPAVFRNVLLERLMDWHESLLPLQAGGTA